MKSSNRSKNQMLRLVESYWQWRALWIATTVVFGCLGLFYVVFLKGDTWVASQGLIVRDEANGAAMRLGRFESQTEMKAAQETILEMARNSQVLEDALVAVGREPGWFGWTRTGKPTSSEIDDLARNGIVVRAPRGAELGTTEVIYLDVKQSSRERAVELNRAVCDSLEKRLKQVRKTRAIGVISELESAKIAASKNLAAATTQLQELEAGVGSDLSDLRNLTDSSSANSSTRQTLDMVTQELRQAELDLRQIENDLATARETWNAPDELLLTPTGLVNSQPGLKRLREGLAAAALATSELRGRYTDVHPKVVAALETELRIRSELRSELRSSVETLSKDYELTKAQIANLKDQQQELERRIAKLASVRAGYSNVASEVQARNIQLQEIERELAAAEATRDAAQTSSLVTRLDEPILGEKPEGPGRTTILAGVTTGGLFFGFGVVFLLTPLDGNVNYGRRRQDYDSSNDRRAAAPSMAEQASEAPIAKSPASGERRVVPASMKWDVSDELIGEGRPEAAAAERRPRASSPVQAAGNSVAEASTKAAPVASPTQPESAPARNAMSEEESMAAAQAVIASALHCSFSQDAQQEKQASSPRSPEVDGKAD